MPILYGIHHYSVIMDIWIDDIHMPANYRTIVTIDTLAESIRRDGLRYPLTVRIMSERFSLLSGFSRLAACRQLKHRKVPCFVVGDGVIPGAYQNQKPRL